MVFSKIFKDNPKLMLYPFSYLLEYMSYGPLAASLSINLTMFTIIFSTADITSTMDVTSLKLSYLQFKGNMLINEENLTDYYSIFSLFLFLIARLLNHIIKTLFKKEINITLKQKVIFAITLSTALYSTAVLL